MGIASALAWALVGKIASILNEPTPLGDVHKPVLDAVRMEPQTSGMLRLVPDPVSKTVTKPPAYDPAAAPGRFEHRSIDCDRHGPNVAGYRAYKGAGAFQCCACAVGEQDGSLAAAWAETAKQRQKALQALGWRE